MEKFGTQALIVGFTIAFLFGAWKALRWKWGQQHPDTSQPVAQAEAAKPSPTAPSAPVAQKATEPLERTPVEMGKFSKWEPVWNRTMAIFPDDDGVLYELKDKNGKITEVMVEKTGDSMTYTIRSPRGVERKIVRKPDDETPLNWGVGTIEQRVKPMKDDISYWVKKN